MLKLFITGILVTSLLVSGCVSETSNDPWNGNLYLDSNEKVRSLDPTKEKLYSSQGTEDLDEVVKKMPYKVKLPTNLTFKATSIWAGIKLVGTQNFDGVNMLGNDQALEVYYINHEEQKIVQLNIDRFKQLSFAPNLKYKKSIPLQNGAETWLLERGDFFTWRQDNLNYSIAGNLTEEEFVAIANSLKNP